MLSEYINLCFDWLIYKSVMWGQKYLSYFRENSMYRHTVIALGLEVISIRRVLPRQNINMNITS